MSENMNEKDTEVVVKRGFLAWLDNFWYHYKWHSIISLFLVFAVTVCTLQMCGRTEYDVHIMYAGSHRVSRQNKDGDVAEYAKILSALKSVSEDFDGNGETNVGFLDLHILSNSEMQETEDYSAQQVLSDREKLVDNFGVSDYYLCFVSKNVYEEYKESSGARMFVPLAQYVKEGSDVEYYAEDAVYLSSADFYSLAGIKELPEDTLICIRNLNAVSSHFDSKNAEKQFKRAVSVFSDIVN